MLAWWGKWNPREVGPHTAVNPDHGSNINCYACGQGWFYADLPPEVCRVRDFIDSHEEEMYIFFREAQAQHRHPWYDLRPEELGLNLR